MEIKSNYEGEKSVLRNIDRKAQLQPLNPAAWLKVEDEECRLSSLPSN